MHHLVRRFGATALRRTAFLSISSMLLIQSAAFAQRPVTDDPNEPLPKPNFDAFSQAPIRSSVSAAAAAAPAAQGAKTEAEGRLGVPTFMWAAQPGPAAQPGAAGRNGVGSEEAAARRHLSENAAHYNLSTAEASSAILAGVHNIGRGAVIVRFKQAVGGVEIFREELKVVMNQNLQLVATSGYLVGSAGSTGTNRTTFVQSPEQAIAAAASDLLNSSVSVTAFQKTGQAGAYEQHQLAPSAGATFRLDSPARVKKVLYRLPDHLESAYYVEVNAGVSNSPNTLYYSYVFSAIDGRILYRHNLTAEDSFSYRVWADPTTKIPLSGPYGAAANPHPTALPDGTQTPFVAPSLVTLQNFPFTANNPWLPANATTTVGNNVEAYADISTPDGFTANSSDTYAFTTSTGVFDRTYDVLQDPASSSQTQAAVTQLFYDINFFHDWYYDSGFKEADGNAQFSNFGRGGLGNDSIKAEAYDFSGRNNANMSTPSDGGRPRMQMYLFDGGGQAKATITSPASIAGEYQVGTATFGPQTFSVTGQFVLVNDGVGTTTDGCETPFANAAAVNGKIAVIDRGVCGFVVKTKNAQLNGAIGVLLVNNAAGIANLGGTDATITIGTLSVTKADGAAIKSQIANAVNGTLSRAIFPDRNGAIDNQIIAHEWGHYISNRLILDSNGIGSFMSRGLGEGWADFHALLLTAKASDTANPTNATFNGVYALGAYATPAFSLNNNNFYFGIRRYPYSTDMSKDPLTYHHISSTVSLPASSVAPVNSVIANGADNAEVHNTGEIWASMLWESYASLLRDTLGASPRLTFAQAQGRMKDYLIGAYKVTPVNPTLLEARNALIAVAYANDPIDGQKFWQAFAKRGAGVTATAPDRFDPANADGLVESFASNAGVETTAATLLDNLITCNVDGFLDNGDTGTLNLTLKYSGTVALTSPTATISSTNPNVHFPNGSTLKLAAINGPFAVFQLPLKVSLSGATGIQQLDFNVSIADPALTTPITTSVTVPGNVSLGFSATTEDPQTPVSAYQPVVSQGSQQWQHLQTSLSPSHYRWHGPDEGAISDTSLVTPPLAVGTDPLTITFKHRYSFEFDSAGFYDGGVVEISKNNGASWTDIGTAYDHTLSTGGGNPLEARPAYSAISPTWPAFRTQTLSLGTAYAGQTILVRFRIGSDIFSGAYGWDLENIAFTGVTNSVFRTLVVDAGCVTAQLGITKSHSGNFALGQTGATYSIKVNNAGTGPTSGTVQVVDTLPAGLTATGISGSGWTCTLGTLTCTRSDALAAGAAYAPITVVVNVAANAPSSLVNIATVSGGSANSTPVTTSDSTNINARPDLTVSKSHLGDFAPGQVGAVYTLKVSNVGSGPSTGPVLVYDDLPFGLVATAIGGNGWTCDLASLSCIRADVLPANAAYAPVTLVVNVISNAPPTVTNSAGVLGGGDSNTANNTATDLTAIGRADLQVLLTHDGDFRRGQTDAVYALKVVNWGTAPTNGTVNVVDILPAGLTASAISGAGWSCTLAPLACTRTDALRPNVGYAPITLVVSVAPTAAATVVNTATVSGGGDLNQSNNTALDSTNVK